MRKGFIDVRVRHIFSPFKPQRRPCQIDFIVAVQLQYRFCIAQRGRRYNHDIAVGASTFQCEMPQQTREIFIDRIATPVELVDDDGRVEG